MRRKDPAARRAEHLMLVASVIDGLRRETSGFIDEATRAQYEQLSESLRRCAFSGPAGQRA